MYQRPAQQGWADFLNMLNNFIQRNGSSREKLASSEKLPIVTPPPPPSDKQQPSYAEILSKGTSPQKFPVQAPLKQSTSSEAFFVKLNSSVLAPDKQRKLQRWIQKDKEVFKEDFENLWVLS